ncbi:putative bifunctional diguanylate cyclase/phosphodiesterase [Rhodobacter viridis]|uniref:putative bifunctional diguanylate cyclase/phosphodiesterase n=1 Tax=Rhodobacter viridis TaxID=1054202 RepID=UPI001FE3B916|nr:EAL domain-containing protein [Rhodobacter viridis]
MFSLLGRIRAVLTKHPSPEDVTSVVHGTSAGVMVTAVNAVIYALDSLRWDHDMFVVFWIGAVFALGLALSRMSRRAAGRKVTRVSRRAARRLILTSVLLAAPWAALPLHVLGMHDHGEPMVVLLVCTGMLAGGAFMLHRAFVASLAFQATILSAVILSFHLGGWAQAWAVTLYALVYGGFLAYFSYSAGEIARQRDESVSALSLAVENLRQARDENYLLANIDDTTGLLNRKAFNARLAEAVARQRTNGQGFTLFLMDLDRFKNINDLFGHGVGDELLAEIARRLRANLPAGDVIARLGGDEFAVILAEVSEAAKIRPIADRLLAAFDQPAQLAGRRVHPGTSIGAVLCPEDGTDPVELLLKADLALNRAKETGRGQCLQFDEQLRQKVISSDRIEAGLREALEGHQLFVQYQPKLALTDGRLLGAEALVRWRTPEGVDVAPDSFLAIAAERGMLPNLSRQIAETVAENMTGWRSAGLDPGKIALNIHPDDIKSPELLLETIGMFEAAGITGQDLLIEITEGCFIGRGTDMAISLLDSLADRGYELSLDDFGTGHASLSDLKKVPVAELKIDRSFIAGLSFRREDRAIVAAIAEMARGMGIRSVAEGVEDETQRSALVELGVDAGQGYLWASPMNAGDFAQFLDREARRTG